MLYAYPWLNLVAQDLGDPATDQISSAARRALALLGVSHVIMLPQEMANQLQGDTEVIAVLLKRGIPWDTGLLSREDIIPLVFGPTGSHLVLASPRVQPLPREQLARKSGFYIAADWWNLLEAMRVDQRTNQLNFISVTVDQPAESLPGTPELQIRHEAIRNQDVTVQIAASCDCFLRLAVSYYAELRARLDGLDVPLGETKDHFCYLRCPAGPHEITISATLTPLRRSMLWVSSLTLVVWLFALLRPWRLRRRPPNNGGDRVIGDAGAVEKPCVGARSGARFRRLNHGC
jgi:hypothetical protein